MNPAHRLFVAACELGVSERAALLDAECAGQPELRAAVLELLRHFDQSPPFLRAPEAAKEPRLPDQIGPYRILGELGRGGMGVVYRAEQPHPRRAVALKLLHHAMANETTRRRFAHEIETLGRLRHAGIAQIFAAGFWELGTMSQPYFAMELVDGTPLTTFARAHALPVPARLELLCQVCDAVQHAHENGVIHRDLKPANVLVTGGGAAPAQVRILDFGIARSLGAAGDSALLTRSGEVLGTLAYMSPEQIAGHSDEVSARSDVYMLGVLLYELLTGRLPLDVDGCTLARAAQLVCDQEPSRLGRLDSALRGDLEVIAATALCKEAERRYASAQALGDDLRRFLRQEPIRARPQTALYQLRKFTRRNRALVGGVAATMLMLLLGLIGVTVLAHRLAQAQQRAELGAEELRATLYHSQMRLAGGAITAHGGLASVRDLLAEWLPAPGQQDLRGWEWRWLDALANAHVVGVAPEDDYRWVAWPAPGTLLTLGARGVVRLDPTTGQALGLVLGVPTSHAEITADGRQLVTCSNDVVSVHDLQSGAQLCRWPTRLPNPSLRVDPSGRLCAVHQSGAGSTPARIEWCELATGALVHAIEGTRPGGLAAAMAFSADGARFAYYADDHTVRVADTSSGQIVASLAQVAGASALAFAPDREHLAIASFGGCTLLWQLRTGAHRILAGHRHQITCVAFRADSAILATAGAEGDLRLWSVAQGTGRLLGAHHLGVQGLAFSPDHQRLVTVGRNELRIWPTDRLAAWRPLSGGDQWSHAEVTVGAGSDGSQVAGGAVQLPQGAAGQLVHVRNGHTGAVLDAVPGVNLDQTRDGRRLAFFHDHLVQVRALGEPTVLAALTLPGVDVLHDLKWRPSGEALALSHATGVTVWWPGTAMAALHQPSPFHPTHLAWHPGGERLAVVQPGVKELLLLEVHPDRLAVLAPVSVTPLPAALEWSADGARAAVARTDGVVEIRDGNLRTVLHRVQAHTQEAVALAWSPDGTRLATGGRDQCLRLFDTRSWHEVLMVPHPRDVISLSWSADGKCLVSACPWGHVQVFDAGVREVARPAPQAAR